LCTTRGLGFKLFKRLLGPENNLIRILTLPVFILNHGSANTSDLKLTGWLKLKEIRLLLANRFALLTIAYISNYIYKIYTI
jgi:hypothetical protein